MAVESRQAFTLDALITADPAEFDRRFEVVLAGVRSVVQGTIHRTLHSHFATPYESTADSVDDLTSETMLLLVRRVRQLRIDGSLDAIQNFSAYAATVASNVCHGNLRRRYPAWTRLKNQVRYIVRNDPDLALQDSESGVACCVLKESNRGHSEDHTDPSMPLPDLVKSIIRKAGRAVELNTVVSTIAETRGIRDIAAATSVNVDRITEQVPDHQKHDLIDDVSFLKETWQEVTKLPLRQRVALLLNLRDDAGRSVLALFPLTATASTREIADALEMPPEELERIWNDLPIDDFRIANRLAATRQQVINLRKAARARLARRLAARRS